jgi:hypothetical protein
MGVPPFLLHILQGYLQLHVQRILKYAIPGKLLLLPLININKTYSNLTYRRRRYEWYISRDHGHGCGFDGESFMSRVRIDSPGNLGAYQDVEFKLNDEGEWKLSNYAIKVKLRSIDKVEIIKTPSFPTQVFLKVSGIHARCQGVGEFRSELEGKHFNVTIYRIYHRDFKSISIKNRGFFFRRCGA